MSLRQGGGAGGFFPLLAGNFLWAANLQVGSDDGIARGLQTSSSAKAAQLLAFGSVLCSLSTRGRVESSERPAASVAKRLCHGNDCGNGILPFDKEIRQNGGSTISRQDGGSTISRQDDVSTISRQDGVATIVAKRYE
jgi:hypothetical protein